MENINWIAVIVAMLSSFVLGGIWYSKKVFGGVWAREANFSQEKMRHPTFVFPIAFIMWFIAACSFSWFVGVTPGLMQAVCFGLLIGLAWVSSSFAVNYLFGGRSLKLFLIDAGYHSIQFVLYGVIFGLWK